MTERPQVKTLICVDNRTIFAESPGLLEIQAFGGRRKLQKETSDFRRKLKIFAEKRRLREGQQESSNHHEDQQQAHQGVVCQERESLAHRPVPGLGDHGTEQRAHPPLCQAALTTAALPVMGATRLLTFLVTSTGLTLASLRAALGSEGTGGPPAGGSTSPVSVGA